MATQNNNVLTNIRGAPGNWVVANIRPVFVREKEVGVLVNILVETPVANLVGAAIWDPATPYFDNYVGADLRGTPGGWTIANIVNDSSHANLVLAYITTDYVYNNSVVANLADAGLWTVRYEADVLPDSDTPAWTLYSAGTPTREIISSQLHLVTATGVATESFYEIDDANIDENTGVTVETRVRVVDDGGLAANNSPTSFYIGTENNFARVSITETQVRLEMNLGVDITSIDGTSYHTYTLTIVGTTATLYVDGYQYLQVTEGTYTGGWWGVGFGDDAETSKNSEAYWDYVYYSVQGEILTGLKQDNASVANILVGGNTSSSDVSANILETQLKNNSVAGNILERGSQPGEVVANILGFLTNDSNSLANLIKTQSSSSDSVGNIKNTYDHELNSIANIAVTNTRDNEVKAGIVASQSQSSLAGANILITNTANTSTLANILLIKEENTYVVANLKQQISTDNKTAASIFTTLSTDNQSKSNILSLVSKNGLTLGNISSAGSAAVESVANITVENSQGNQTKAHIVYGQLNPSSVIANIQVRKETELSALANIKVENSYSSQSGAQLLTTNLKENNSVANILSVSAQNSSSVANILSSILYSSDVKAYIILRTSKDAGSMANIKSETEYLNSVRGNIKGFRDIYGIEIYTDMTSPLTRRVNPYEDRL